MQTRRYIQASPLVSRTTRRCICWFRRQLNWPLRRQFWRRLWLLNGPTRWNIDRRLLGWHLDWVIRRDIRRAITHLVLQRTKSFSQMVSSVQILLEVDFRIGKYCEQYVQAIAAALLDID